MEKLLDLLPGWLKCTVLAIALVAYVPFWARERVDSRVYAVIEPMKERRDLEIKYLNEKLTSIDNKLDILIQRQ